MSLHPREEYLPHSLKNRRRCSRPNINPHHRIRDEKEKIKLGGREKEWQRKKEARKGRKKAFSDRSKREEKMQIKKKKKGARSNKKV